jgi:hypothetical protein
MPTETAAAFGLQANAAMGFNLRKSLRFRSDMIDLQRGTHVNKVCNAPEDQVRDFDLVLQSR